MTERVQLRSFASALTS